jgi:transcriptional regulator with XRE-family HTH domain
MSEATESTEKDKKLTLQERRDLVREFRKRTGCTLVELGELADVSNPMLSQFETGARNLSEKAWERVLDAMKAARKDPKAVLHSQPPYVQRMWHKMRVLYLLLKADPRTVADYERFLATLRDEECRVALEEMNTKELIVAREQIADTGSALGGSNRRGIRQFVASTQPEDRKRWFASAENLPITEAEKLLNDLRRELKQKESQGEVGNLDPLFSAIILESHQRELAEKQALIASLEARLAERE